MLTLFFAVLIYSYTLGHCSAKLGELDGVPMPNRIHGLNIAFIYKSVYIIG